jgi:hypothetical protein
MATAQAPQVGVVGLRALNRDIKRATDNSGPIYAVMAQAGRMAAQPVADQTRSSLPQVETSEHPAGTMAADVRISATRSGAKVSMGRKSLPYAGPLEFGGWPHGRQFIANGRYLFPAAVSLASTSAQLYESAIESGFASFPWTNTTSEGAAVHD